MAVDLQKINNIRTKGTEVSTLECEILTIGSAIAHRELTRSASDSQLLKHVLFGYKHFRAAELPSSTKLRMSYSTLLIAVNTEGFVHGSFLVLTCLNPFDLS